MSCLRGITVYGQQVVHETWIFHNFHFDSFCLLGFLKDFTLPTARLGGSVTRMNIYAHDIKQAFYSGYL